MMLLFATPNLGNNVSTVPGLDVSIENPADSCDLNYTLDSCLVIVKSTIQNPLLPLEVVGYGEGKNFSFMLYK
jgi:hypothetical protein